MIHIREILADELTKLGFAAKKTSWCRRRGELIHVVGLQRSDWGRQHYVNLGLWVNTLGANEFPKPQECHVQCRLEMISDAPAGLAEALDEEDYWRMDAEHRREVIKLALCNADFVFFRHLNTIDDLSRFLKRNRELNCLVTRSLHEILAEKGFDQRWPAE